MDGTETNITFSSIFIYSIRLTQIFPFYVWRFVKYDFISVFYGNINHQFLLKMIDQQNKIKFLLGKVKFNVTCKHTIINKSFLSIIEKKIRLKKWNNLIPLFSHVKMRWFIIPTDSKEKLNLLIMTLFVFYFTLNVQSFDEVLWS